jgi:hypothetical protein
VNHGTLQTILDQELNRAGDSGPLLTDILSRGQRAGYHRMEIWEAIIAVFGKAEQQQRWQNWTRLDDREEIRLRLKVLLHCGSTDPVLNNFITFFFRASDPVLYQLSAVIIGRELNRHQDLKDYFHSYCSKRGADPSVPVKLNGQRTRRRILLVQCAAAAWSEDEPGKDFIMPEQPFDVLNDSDISILFSAASMLLSHNRGESSAEYVKQLLRRRYEFDRPVRDRNLIRNTGILMQRFHERGEPAGDLFNLCFNRILTQYNRAASFASRLQALLLMDELMESSVHIGLSFSGSGGGDTPGGRFNRFLQCRLSYWSYMNRKPFDPGKDEFRRDADSVVDRVYQTRPYENHEVQYRIFADQVHLLGDLSRWRTFSLEERSYRAFFLTDYSLHPELFDDEELFLLLESNGYLEHLQDKKLREGELKNPLSPVMNRLLEAEPSVSRELFDPQLIHRLDSPGLLPALIPTETDSELLPVLADAVEHQVRFQLATDPSFHPDHFLYLVTVRRPHPKFFRYLAELSAGREYHHPQLGNWLLHETAQYLAGATSNGKRQTLPFWEVLSSSHKTMNDAATSDDPFSTLNVVIRELKGTGTEKAQEGITLHDLLEIVQPGKGPWYCSGSPPMTAQPGRSVADQITRIAGRLEEKAGKLRPPTLGDSFLVSENVQSIVQILGQVGEEVVPLLGSNEADALSHLMERCIVLLREWEAKYSESAAINSESDGDTERRRAIALAAIRAGHGSLQQALINMFIDTELERCSVQEDSDEVWLGTFKFLEWAADFGEMKAAADEAALLWHTRLEEIWAGLAAEAMERNAEARVAQLVRNKAFAGIRKGKTGRDTLQQVKTWCFNRYDFHHAHLCNVESGGAKMGASLLRTFREYSGHFARVWLALFIGVIFMFDFGDPWTELAEIGDVGGVMFAFTFGVAGTFLYVWTDLRKNTVHLKGDPFQWVSVFTRVAFFLAVTLIYTALVVLLFWYMFSSTDQVVHGEYAPLHLLSWTGFALFVGVFFGLIGKSD